MKYRQKAISEQVRLRHRRAGSEQQLIALWDWLLSPIDYDESPSMEQEAAGENNHDSQESSQDGR